VQAMLKSSYQAMHLCMESGSSNMPNGHPTLSHAQITHTLSKWDEFKLFGKVRSRGITFMLKTFSFEAWIMINFEVEVRRIKHIKTISKYQAICSLLPP
jgi:hypothetical protein